MEATFISEPGSDTPVHPTNSKSRPPIPSEPAEVRVLSTMQSVLPPPPPKKSPSRLARPPRTGSILLDNNSKVIQPVQDFPESMKAPGWYLPPPLEPDPPKTLLPVLPDDELDWNCFLDIGKLVDDGHWTETIDSPITEPIEKPVGRTVKEKTGSSFGRPTVFAHGQIEDHQNSGKNSQILQQDTLEQKKTLLDYTQAKAQEINAQYKDARRRTPMHEVEEPWFAGEAKKHALSLDPGNFHMTGDLSFRRGRSRSLREETIVTGTPGAVLNEAGKFSQAALEVALQPDELAGAIRRGDFDLVLPQWCGDEPHELSQAFSGSVQDQQLAFPLANTPHFSGHPRNSGTCPVSGSLVNVNHSLSVRSQLNPLPQPVGAEFSGAQVYDGFNQTMRSTRLIGFRSASLPVNNNTRTCPSTAVQSALSIMEARNESSDDRKHIEMTNEEVQAAGNKFLARREAYITGGSKGVFDTAEFDGILTNEVKQWLAHNQEKQLGKQHKHTIQPRSKSSAGEPELPQENDPRLTKKSGTSSIFREQQVLGSDSEVDDSGPKEIEWSAVDRETVAARSDLDFDQSPSPPTIYPPMAPLADRRPDYDLNDDESDRLVAEAEFKVDPKPWGTSVPAPTGTFTQVDSSNFESNKNLDMITASEDLSVPGSTKQKEVSEPEIQPNLDDEVVNTLRPSDDDFALPAKKMKISGTTRDNLNSEKISVSVDSQKVVVAFTRDAVVSDPDHKKWKATVSENGQNSIDDIAGSPSSSKSGLTGRTSSEGEDMDLDISDDEVMLIKTPNTPAHSLTPAPVSSSALLPTTIPNPRVERHKPPTSSQSPRRPIDGSNFIQWAAASANQSPTMIVSPQKPSLTTFSQCAGSQGPLVQVYRAEQAVGNPRIGMALRATNVGFSSQSQNPALQYPQPLHGQNVEHGYTTMSPAREGIFSHIGFRGRFGVPPQNLDHRQFQGAMQNTSPALRSGVPLNPGRGNSGAVKRRPKGTQQTAGSSTQTFPALRASQISKDVLSAPPANLPPKPPPSVHFPPSANESHTVYFTSPENFQIAWDTLNAATESEAKGHFRITVVADHRHGQMIKVTGPLHSGVRVWVRYLVPYGREYR